MGALKPHCTAPAACELMLLLQECELPPHMGQSLVIPYCQSVSALNTHLPAQGLWCAVWGSTIPQPGSALKQLALRPSPA